VRRPMRLGRPVRLLVGLGLVILFGVVLLSIDRIARIGSSPDTAAPVIGGTPEPRVPADACTPGEEGDQDRYVYRPERLQLLKPCMHMTGTVDHLVVEPDGDVHLSVRPDPAYQGLLVEANKPGGGYLVVETVCYSFSFHADAMGLCAADTDRMQNIPQAGDHVWMEGRYVLDVGHSAWAELHPLYRWGEANP